MVPKQFHSSWALSAADPSCILSGLVLQIDALEATEGMPAQAGFHRLQYMKNLLRDLKRLGYKATTKLSVSLTLCLWLCMCDCVSASVSVSLPLCFRVYM